MWMHVYDIGHFIQREGAFRCLFKLLCQGTSKSKLENTSELWAGARVPNCNIDRSPQSSAETSQKCGQPLELILDERKNDNGWIMFELKGDGFYKRCFKLQTAPPTLHSSSFLGRVWRWHHHTPVSRVTCWCHARVTCRSVCRMSVVRQNGLLWRKQVIRSDLVWSFVTKTHVGWDYSHVSIQAIAWIFMSN